MTEAASIIRNIDINSSLASSQDVSLAVAKREKLVSVVTINGEAPLTLNIKADVEEDGDLTLLVINRNNAAVTLNENTRQKYFSKAVIAHAELNNADTNLETEYELLEEGSELNALSVSLSAVKKIFHQNTIHKAGNTTAHINNYGVVMAHGLTDMVVKNTIEKGSHGSSTHQTSRLLTYDRTAIGKILPILYIYDNDVAASHAATLGQPDEEQLYYLQSRGLARSEALKLITTGYLLPITKIIDNPEIDELLKQEIEEKVSQGCLM